MNHNKTSLEQKTVVADAAQPSAITEANQTDINFVHAPDEIARRAYFSYVNEGSRPGRDVQHWLEAEKQLLEERNLTRVHGFHHRT